MFAGRAVWLLLLVISSRVGMNTVHSVTCDVSSSVLIRVLFFNICFNLLLHLRDKEVCLARKWSHIVDDVCTTDLNGRECAQLPLL